MNYRNRERAKQLTVLNSNENIIVRYDIRTQVETSMLCTTISQSALELTYTDIMKKIHAPEEPGTMNNSNCVTRIRYLLPCSHQIHVGVLVKNLGSPRKLTISWRTEPCHRWLGT
ncbi:hypothetical protein V1509DRAFT_634373 [Lipomyces kononenkoae]